jgi:uncharacterized membrane protein YdbT with pleckstrin-like domain
MDDIERLEDDEQVVFRTRFHPIVLAGTIEFSAFVIGIVALIVVRNELTPDTIRLLWLAAAVVVASGMVSPLLRWRTSTFVVTNRRMLVRTRMGLFSVQAVESPLSSIGEVEVKEPLVGRLLGYGTLRLVDRSGRAEAFRRVAHPQGVRDALRRQVARHGRARAR